MREGRLAVSRQEPALRTIQVGVGWSTDFSHREGARYPRLPWAYRAPSLLARGLRGHGPPTLEARVIGLDEALRLSDLCATPTDGPAADLLYLCGHGEYRAGHFTFVLHDDEWSPAAQGLVWPGPSVAVFDAGNLVDFDDAGWREALLDSGVGAGLRLLLGYASLATGSRGGGLRGAEFARRLREGEPIASAWCRAVHATAPSEHDVAIAIAFGATKGSARRLLDTARLEDLPLPAEAPSDLAWTRCP